MSRLGNIHSRQRNRARLKKFLRLGTWMRGWSPGGDHCSPQFPHRNLPGIRWLMTPWHLGHSIDSGIVADCRVACFSPSSARLESSDFVISHKTQVLPEFCNFL